MSDICTRTDPDDVENLRVETVRNGRLLRVVFHGECDFSMIPELDQALQDVELDEIRLVQLDLTHLTFADVATIRTLAVFAGNARRTGLDVESWGEHHTLAKVAGLLHLHDELGLTRPTPRRRVRNERSTGDVEAREF
jgi:anti-anti-sigma regulatory factor